ncbi:ankyrin repeat protein [Aspergillus sp. HF37]|nr:ankyrin repeat protein [Aspergillus sp. HF37]
MSSIGSDAHDRLEPRLLKAAEDDDLEALQHTIELARENGQLTDVFLRIGLTRSCDRGHIAATRYLLSLGAKPDAPSGSTKPSPLLRAVERGESAIVELLLEYGASLETRDKRGWTALMMATWGDQRGMVELLLGRGAYVNAKDGRGRNVLHNLAADKHCDSGYEVVEFLLDRAECLVDGRDQVGRSPLHWACATGKPRLAVLLLTRPRGPVANVDAVEQRNKTALHLAVAHGREDIVLLLLQHRAQVNARSDGGWTPLHNACDKGSEAIVRLLLQAGADINGQLLNGVTPLHLAAQAGHREAVEVLLERKDLKRRVRDNFGSTPFLRAAQFKRKDVVLLLAPFNNVEALTSDARGACEGFDATIVDFGNFRNENRVQKTSVFNLLYGRDAENPRKQAVTTIPADTATDFRWIHLPANNMAWVEALLTKSFIEEGSHDVEGFKGLEKSFNYQHRGRRIHSNFMRPLCQSAPRAQWSREEDSSGERSDQAQERADHNQPSRRRQLYDNLERADSYCQDDSHNSQGKKGKGPTKRGKSGAQGTLKQFEKKKAQLARRDTNQSALSVCKDNNHSIACNVWAFMPYLHFESAEKRQKMQDAIQRAETLNFPQPGISRISTRDEQLINAHLLSSTASLHVRRTLDQFFYPNIDTRIRDQDQVVYRYQTAGNCRERSWRDPKIFMVDQLWMWILGTNLIVTSFPQRWEQPRNDPLNVLDGIIEDINSKTRDPVRSVYDLAITITSRCSGVFDRHRMGDEEYQFLDMFEASIGTATDRETVLFKEFNTASAQASDWLKNHRKPLARFTWSDEDKPSVEERYTQPLFVDRLLDIGQETDLLAETKDIRDELNMISTILQHQQHILLDFLEVICEIYFGQQRSQYEVKKRFKEQQRTIDMHLKDITRMDKQAERIYASITDLLDLKQKHANAFEARFARDQAAGTTRQGKIIMVFTIVTIVFLPLSFITSFFSIDMVQFPPAYPGSDKVSISYVAKYTFGIGFAISIPLILLALVVDDIGVLFRLAVRQLRRLVFGARRGRQAVDERKQDLDLDRILSVARTRRSVETELGSVLPVSERGRRKSFSIRQGVHEL